MYDNLLAKVARNGKPDTSRPPERPPKRWKVGHQHHRTRLDKTYRTWFYKKKKIRNYKDYKNNEIIERMIIFWSEILSLSFSLFLFHMLGQNEEVNFKQLARYENLCTTCVLSSRYLININCISLSLFLSQQVEQIRKLRKESPPRAMNLRNVKHQRFVMTNARNPSFDLGFGATRDARNADRPSSLSGKLIRS